MKVVMRKFFGKSNLIFVSLATALTSMIALSGSAYADNDIVVDDVTLSIPVSCTLAGVGADSHVTSLQNGIYGEGIGTTTLTATCNDVNGYAIYAIGYSGDTYGSTKMLSNVDSQYDFDTGLYVADNSVSTWSMKLAATGTSYVPTIENDFDNYHVVPSSYTKVASYLSGTDVGDGAIGSKLTTTYDTYISRTQTAGTYTGKVIYTLVHPNTTSAPVIP